MTLQAIPTLLATTVLTGQGQVNESAFANSTANGSTGSATTADIFGINQSAISVSSPGSVVGSVVAGLSGTALSVGGNADADAGSSTGSNLVGIAGDGNTGFVSIGGTGSVQGSLLATLTAAGTSSAGNSDATAGILNAIGISSGDISINGDGTVAGLAQVTQSATARSTAGASNADAQVDSLRGFGTGPTSPSIQIAGTGALYGAASLVSTATAITTGDNAAVDTADASQRITRGIGLDLNGLSPAAVSTIGAAAAITGQVEVVGTANASATTANSSAVTNGGDLFGVRSSDFAPLQGNSAAVVTAAASGVLTARSTTTSGGSSATVDGNVFGVNGGSGSIAIGANGVLNASALLDTTAVASTIDGLGSNATASTTSGSGSVIGVGLGNGTAGLAINGSGTISGTAQMNQLASATTVSNGNATASVLAGAPIAFGIEATIINVEGSSPSFFAGSNVNANANSGSVSGNATANDGSLEARGLSNSFVSIEGSSLGNLRATSNLTETLSASSVSGNASTSGFGSLIFGFRNSDLSVAGTANTAVASGTLSLTQTSQSTSGQAASVDLPAQAYNVFGISNGNMSLGSNGSIDSAATTTLNLKALNVSGNSDAFFAAVTSATDMQTSGNNLAINGSGNINSLASANGLVEASSTSGPARAGSTQTDSIGVLGILSSSSDISFSIAGQGSITAEARLGSDSTPFTINSSSVGGSSEAVIDNLGGSNSARSIGVIGTELAGATTLDEKTLLETSAGNISGVAKNSIQFSANSTTGNSSAGFVDSTGNRFQTYGISNARIIIDSPLSSQAVGSTSSTLSATSKSVGGNSLSRLEIESTGLFTDSLNSIQAANTVGQSQISAVSLSSTVLGNSVASSLRNRDPDAGLTAIANYDINSNGAGTIQAISSTSLKSLASSVSGSATGISTL